MANPKTNPARSVDPLAETAPQERLPAEVDPALLAELERLTAENLALRDENSGLLRALDAATAPGARGDDGLAATTQALCDVYRITQAGGTDRQRFYDAAIRGGELLAARLAPPPDAG
jgi:hypothetical protein